MEKIDRHFVLIDKTVLDMVYKCNPELYSLIDDLVELSTHVKLGDDDSEIWNID